MSLLDALPRRTSFVPGQTVRLFTSYLLPVLAVVFALEANFLVAPFLSFLPPFLTFVAAVMVTAWYGGFPPAVFATMLSIVLIHVYFIPPLAAFSLNPADLGVMGFFGAEAMIMGYCVDYLQKSRRRAVNRERDLQRLQELSGRLVEETTLDSMLEEVLKGSIELLGADKGTIQLYESGDQVLRLIKQIGFRNEFSSRFERVPTGAYLGGTAFERRQRILIENVATDGEFAKLTPLFTEFGVVGAQYTPLFKPDGMVFGVLSSYWSRPYRPSAGDLNLLDLYAHHAERILLYKRNEELLHQANEELERRVTGKQVLLMERDVKLTKLMSELLLTEERERRQLSGELHDSLVQLLSVAKMKLALAGRSLKSHDEPPGRYIQETERVLDRSLEYTRTLMAELDPPGFETSGLSAALVWLKDRMQEYDLRVTLHLEAESVVLPRHHLVLLYQSVRELLMNVVKHAKVDTATVSMRMKPGQILEITVQDQGLGFRPGFGLSVESRQMPGHHFGLRSVRVRVENLGGQLHIQSEIGQGCTVTLTLPLRETLESRDERAAETTRQERVGAPPQADPNQQSLPLA